MRTCMLDVSVASEITILGVSPPAYSFPQHRSIIKRVTTLEYKLHRLILNKEDFTAYVQVDQHNYINPQRLSVSCLIYWPWHLFLITVRNQHFRTRQEEKGSEYNIVLIYGHIYPTCNSGLSIVVHSNWLDDSVVLVSFDYPFHFHSTYITSSKGRRLSTPSSIE